MTGECGVEMPRYRCHKQVHALQIESVSHTTLAFKDQGYAPMVVDLKLFSRYTPVPGDYYVVYDDGYASISPQKSFEEGYTRL